MQEASAQFRRHSPVWSAKRDVFAYQNELIAMPEKIHDGRSNRGMSPSSEAFVLQLIMVITIFVPLGFAGRLLTNYLIGSGWFFSSLGAIVGTLLSMVIFIPLERFMRLPKTLTWGLLINTLLLVIFHAFLWKPNALTLKYFDVYLFRDGSVTSYGILYFFVFAFWDSIISCLGLVIYSRISERFKAR